MSDPIRNLRAARFYAILDAGYVPEYRWAKTAEALVRGGADIVQLRAKQVNSAARGRLLDAILPLFVPSDGTPSPPPLVVNDDIDLCLRYPELGLHVGQDDLPVAEARKRLGAGRILGLSTHSLSQAKAAMVKDELDYFAVGPVFATSTKPDYAPVGLKLVEEVAGLDPDLPFFCIGGINRTNLDSVLRAGARRVVAVSDVLSDPDPAAAVRQYRVRIADHFGLE